jgi:hypothetical protein
VSTKIRRNSDEINGVAKLKDVTEPTEQTKEKKYRQPDR